MQKGKKAGSPLTKLLEMMARLQVSQNEFRSDLKKNEYKPRRIKKQIKNESREFEGRIKREPKRDLDETTRRVTRTKGRSERKVAGQTRRLRVLKIQIHTPRIYNQRYGKYVDHVWCWVAKTAHLQPKLDEQSLVEAICRHFPCNIENILIGSRASTIQQLVRTLGRVQETNGYFGHLVNWSPSYNNYNRRKNDRRNFRKEDQTRNKYMGNKLQLSKETQDQILGPEVLSFAIVYVDDISIVPKNIEEHLEQLDFLIYQLRKAEVTANFMKSKFMQAEVKLLGHIFPDFNPSFFLYIDAFNKALGAHLSQESPSGEIANIAFVSRSLKMAELAIVLISFIQEFYIGISDYTIYRPQESFLFTHVYGLQSRAPLPLIIAAVKKPTQLRELKGLMENLKEKQQADNYLQWISTELQTNEQGKKAELAKSFYIHQDVEKELIRWHHEILGHFGTQKIVAVIKENCCIPNLDKKVKQMVSSCDICQKAKITNKKQESHMKSVLADEPLSVVSVDISGPLPIFFRKILKYYIPTVGQPKIILSDHGSQFMSRRWGDTSRIGHQHSPGDLVLTRTHRQSSALDDKIKKFFLLYEEPCEVVNEVCPNAYRMKYTNSDNNHKYEEISYS
ncbi:hypothetical protein ILUMI_09657 [Ignelater luminosus]|uniref:RNA-directed DNA polymerase n=1 Tax=Ignelater luminosus TaxID=2038154 RepID=A0A8K0GEB6_IGNLU|nr:hypothetical protein ILUMI_09657 [Ignelater luminosus]